MLGREIAPSPDDAKKRKQGQKTAMIQELMEKDKTLQEENHLEEAKALSGRPPPNFKQIHVLGWIPILWIVNGLVETVIVRDHFYLRSGRNRSLFT
ncbi:hypothetical protein PsorP6_010239 [Peronosclerospora sorghi]|uniref:Uncharacterized protein n=1 Tax=Peronosclerospora sorghi TaxID=230839 RepID=A0ACC0VZW9_9STRA|nr:hypothetical protein PsorP6_010239 [Peronosclerospora sorghi]